MTWLAGIPVSGMVKMYSLAASAGCCGCLIVCGTNVEMHLSFVKVSVAVVAGADHLLHLLLRSFTASFLNV